MFSTCCVVVILALTRSQLIITCRSTIPTSSLSSYPQYATSSKITRLSSSLSRRHSVTKTHSRHFCEGAKATPSERSCFPLSRRLQKSKQVSFTRRTRRSEHIGFQALEAYSKIMSLYRGEYLRTMHSGATYHPHFRHTGTH